METLYCHETGTVENLSSSTKFDAIKELIYKTSTFIKAVNIEQLVDAVISREKLQSTGIGQGIAIAHGRTDAVGKTSVVLGISRNGIDFDSPDCKPVNFLFLITNPPDKHEDYMTALSTVARIISNSAFRNEILSMTCPREIEKRFYSACECYMDSDAKAGKIKLKAS